MEFSLPTFTWVLSLKFEDVLFGGPPETACPALSRYSWYLHADPQDHVNHVCHMAALGKEQQGSEVHCHPQLVALVQGQPRLYKTLLRSRGDF